MRHPLLALTGPLALSAALAPSAPAQTTAAALLRAGDALPGGVTVRDVVGVTADLEGEGYALLCRASDDRIRVLASSSGEAPVQATVLYTSEVITGPVGFFLLQEMRGGRVAWQRRAGFTGQGSYIDGVRVTWPGRPTPVPGHVWGQGETLALTTGGGFVTQGRVILPNGLATDALVDVAAAEILLKLGDPIAGTGGRAYLRADQEPITATTKPSWGAVSPSGEHYVAHVLDDQGRACVIVDGALARVADTDLYDGSPFQPGLLAQTPYTAVRFRMVSPATTQPLIDDDGSWAVNVRCEARDASGNVIARQDCLATPRGLITGTNGTLDGADLDLKGGSQFGDALGQTRFSSFGMEDRVESEWGSTVAGRVPVDLDGDGAVDPGFEVEVIRSRMTTNRAGRTFALCDLYDLSAGTDERIIAEFDTPIRGTEVCGNAPNSTGLPARLSSFGSGLASANALELVARNIPEGSFGFAVAGQLEGFVPNPGGSMGDLCLVPPIGRLNQQVFLGDARGSVRIALDLTALPTPSQTVTVAAGETWVFQLWYRDVVQGAQTSNFSSAIRIPFR